MTDVKIPERYKEFFEKVSAKIKMCENGKLLAYPVNYIFGRGRDIPLCNIEPYQGAYLTVFCDTVEELVSSLHTAVLVSEYMAEQERINGCI